MFSIFDLPLFVIQFITSLFLFLSQSSWTLRALLKNWKKWSCKLAHILRTCFFGNIHGCCSTPFCHRLMLYSLRRWIDYSKKIHNEPLVSEINISKQKNLHLGNICRDEFPQIFSVYDAFTLFWGTYAIVSNIINCNLVFKFLSTFYLISELKFSDLCPSYVFLLITLILRYCRKQ